MAFENSNFEPNSSLSFLNRCLSNFVFKVLVYRDIRYSFVNIALSNAADRL